ncbi:N-acetylmuramoyl-L-alanine amidase [Nonomuraea lactucae]|uniref:N-acetylmuramoyl-L-alanine amidase n=1 Tax=Nonomuraea lactucae TaxID=2249762 RepID=UPI000DE26233|nr:N-acetylmuramoyl-L-alanine amidase [Nonomuraea lactucae]
MRADRAAPGILAALVALSTACAATAPSAQRPSAQRPSAQRPPAQSPPGPETRVGVTATSPMRTPGVPALAGKVVVLDPGHNGGNASHPEVINRQVDIITQRKPCNTTGTETDAGYPEHAFAWDVASRLKPLLERAGAEVVLTRPNDTGVGPCINERAAAGNRAEADAVLSIHGDGAAPAGRGFHVILPGLVAGHNDPIVEPSRRLGLAVRDSYRTGTGLPYATYTGRNGLETRTDLGGLNLSTRPAVFVECGNMRNTGDAAKMSDTAFRERVAASLAAGLTKYLQTG